MKTAIRIDIVSDIMCPWCAIGLASLEQALSALKDSLSATIEFHPFELNPAMGSEGENLRDHLIKKYGMTASQSEQNRAQITERGKALGFEFRFSDDMRMHNTFNAHQLLHWALEKGVQLALKKALFKAYFRDHIDVSDISCLVEIAAQVGLDKNEALVVLNEQRYAHLVRDKEQRWQEMGIHSVPAFILNEKYLISGGQPPETFVQALTDIIKNG